MEETISRSEQQEVTVPDDGLSTEELTLQMEESSRAEKELEERGCPNSGYDTPIEIAKKAPLGMASFVSDYVKRQIQ